MCGNLGNLRKACRLASPSSPEQGARSLGVAAVLLFRHHQAQEAAGCIERDGGGAAAIRASGGLGDPGGRPVRQVGAGFGLAGEAGFVRGETQAQRASGEHRHGHLAALRDRGVEVQGVGQEQAHAITVRVSLEIGVIPQAMFHQP